MEPIANDYDSRQRLLTELTLDPPDATSDQAGVPLLDEDYLILSTIHAAEGQEWMSVFVLNVVDGCMPSDPGAGTMAEIEEECRPLYVAITRASQYILSILRDGRVRVISPRLLAELLLGLEPEIALVSFGFACLFPEFVSPHTDTFVVLIPGLSHQRRLVRFLTQRIQCLHDKDVPRATLP